MAILNLLNWEERRVWKIYEKHRTLLYFINKILDVDLIIAEKDACNIEHYISDQTFERLIDFLKEYKGKK